MRRIFTHIGETASGRLLSPATLCRRFETALSDHPPERVTHSCSSSVNAYHNLFAKELGGFPAPSSNAGSWSEWITAPTRPVTVGDK